jgi:hypothetical protein
MPVGLSRRACLFTLAAAGLGGCAFTDVQLEPVTVADQISPRGRGREVLVAPFIDERPLQARCGMKKNGYNADTADVLCPEPHMGDFLGRAFAEHLRASQFALVVPGQHRSADPLFLEGRISELFVEPVIHVFSSTVETDIGVHLRARTQSGLIADRFFYVKGTDSNFWGTDGAFQISFEKATTAVVSSMTRAVADLMDRLPRVGVPGDAPSRANPPTASLWIAGAPSPRALFLAAQPPRAPFREEPR